MRGTPTICGFQDGSSCPRMVGAGASGRQRGLAPQGSSISTRSHMAAGVPGIGGAERKRNFAKPRLLPTRNFTTGHLQLCLQNPASLAAAWAPTAPALFSVGSLALEAQCSQPAGTPADPSNYASCPSAPFTDPYQGQASTSCIVAEACSPVLITARGLVCAWATLTFAFTCRKSSQSCQGHVALKSTPDASSMAA